MLSARDGQPSSRRSRARTTSRSPLPHPGPHWPASSTSRHSRGAVRAAHRGCRPQPVAYQEGAWNSGTWRVAPASVAARTRRDRAAHSYVAETESSSQTPRRNMPLLRAPTFVYSAAPPRPTAAPRCGCTPRRRRGYRFCTSSAWSTPPADHRRERGPGRGHVQHRRETGGARHDSCDVLVGWSNSTQDSQYFARASIVSSRVKSDHEPGHYYRYRDPTWGATTTHPVTQPPWALEEGYVAASRGDRGRRDGQARTVRHRPPP